MKVKLIKEVQFDKKLLLPGVVVEVLEGKPSSSEELKYYIPYNTCCTKGKRYLEPNEYIIIE